jgi:hypothetical protein
MGGVCSAAGAAMSGVERLHNFDVTARKAARRATRSEAAIIAAARAPSATVESIKAAMKG